MDRLAIIENAMNWQAGGEGRRVSIDIGNISDRPFKVFCYDYNLHYGEYADEGQPIDLDAGVKRRRDAEFEKFKAELMGEETNGK
jgi:hypothetical protein